MADAGDKKREADEQKRHQEQMNAANSAADSAENIADSAEDMAKSADATSKAAGDVAKEVGGLQNVIDKVAEASTDAAEAVSDAGAEISDAVEDLGTTVTDGVNAGIEARMKMIVDPIKKWTKETNAYRMKMIGGPLKNYFKQTNLAKIIGTSAKFIKGADLKKKKTKDSVDDVVSATVDAVDAVTESAEEATQSIQDRPSADFQGPMPLVSEPSGLDTPIPLGEGDATPIQFNQETGNFSPAAEESIEEVAQNTAALQEDIQRNNDLLKDGLGVSSPGYLHDIYKFFIGDKLDKVEERREQQKQSEAQLDALETLAEQGDGQGGVVAVEAKGAKGGGLFGGIAAGFQGLLKMLKSVGSFIKDLITGLFDMIAKIMTSIGKGIGGLLKGIAKGLNAFKKESLIGAAAMLIVAGAMFVMAKAMTEFAKTNWKAVAIGLTSLAALAGITFLLGNLSAQVLLGAAGLIIVSGAMYVLAEAMNIFNDVDWKAVAVALTTVVSLGLVAAGLGLIAPIALAGAAAMVVIAGAMYIVAQALKVIAQAMDLAIPFFETIGDVMVNVIGAVAGLIEGSINTIVDGIMKLGSLDATALVATAGAIALLGGAVAGFGTGAGMGGVLAAGAGLITAGLDWLTGGESDPIENLMRLASIGQDLGATTENIGLLSAAMGAFSKHMDSDEIGDAMSGAFEALNDAINELDENKINKKVKALDAVGKSIGNLSATVAGVSMGGEGPTVEMALPKTTQIIRESAADLDAWDLEEASDDRDDYAYLNKGIMGKIQRLMGGGGSMGPGVGRYLKMREHKVGRTMIPSRGRKMLAEYDKLMAEYKANTVEIEKLNEILGGEALEHLKGGAPPVVVVQQNTNSIQGGDKHTTVVPNNVRPMGSGSVGEDDL